MAANLFAANRPIKVTIRAGEHLDKLLYFADSVDISTDPPTLTNAQDFTDWNDLRWAFVSGVDATVSPLFVGQLEVHDELGGILRMQATSAQTQQAESTASREGLIDLFGRDPAGRFKKIRRGVAFVEYAVVEDFT